MGSLKAALERVQSSASLGDSHAGLSLILQLNLAVVKNSSRYLDFLRHCAYYGEIVTASRIPPTSSRVKASHDLRERATRIRFETTAVPVESASNAQGLSSFELNLLTVFTDPRGFCFFNRPARVRNCIQASFVFRTKVDCRAKHPDQESVFLGRGHGWPPRWCTSGRGHARTTARAVVRLGESERFCARGAGDSDEGTRSAVVLSVRAIGFEVSPICDKAMADKSCMHFMILLNDRSVWIPVPAATISICVPEGL